MSNKPLFLMSRQYIDILHHTAKGEQHFVTMAHEEVNQTLLMRGKSQGK